MPQPAPWDNPICFVTPARLGLSAWIQHVPFGMYMVDLLRPSAIVELGTRNGVSYSAFCQAVDRLGLEARCVAVDSWTGDAHTGTYGPAVLADLRRHHDPLYGRFSHLHQGAFDDAAREIADGSIDLLHIDGLHTYEAVRHDFETWKPKLSNRGVVLMHDTAEHSRDFGVWKLWAELAGRYPSFAFRHGHGLGVLGVGPDVPDAVRDLLELPEIGKERIRRFFHRQGRLTAIRVAANMTLQAPLRWLTALLEYARRPGLDSAAGG